MKSLTIALTAALFAFGATAAVAQTAAPAPAPAAKAPVTTPAPATMPAPPADTKKGAKAPRTEELKACSAEADAKNLHGKERKDFRKKCLKDAKAAKKA